MFLPLGIWDLFSLWESVVVNLSIATKQSRWQAKIILNHKKQFQSHCKFIQTSELNSITSMDVNVCDMCSVPFEVL